MLRPVHQYGASPTPQQLGMFVDDIQRLAKARNVSWETINSTDLTYAETYRLLLNQTLTQNQPQLWRWLNKDVDALVPDQRVCLIELLMYAYRLDQMGNQNGNLDRFELALGRGNSDKHYLMEEFERLSEQFAPEDTPKLLEQLKTRLRENRFTAAPDSFHAGYDLSQTQRDEQSGAVRAMAATRNYNEPEQHQVPWSLQDNLKFRMLQTFAETGCMPKVREYDQQKKNAHAIQVEVVPQKPISSDWVRSAVMTSKKLWDLLTHPLQGGETPGFGKQQAFSFKKLETYNYPPGNRYPGMDQLKEDLTQALLAPESRQSLMVLYKECLDAIEQPERLKELLNPVVKTITTALDLPEVPVHISRTSHSESEFSRAVGMYSPGSNQIWLFQDALMAQRDFPAAKTTHGVRQALFEQLLEVLVHEFFHAFQENQLQRWRDGSNNHWRLPFKRVDDYVTNTLGVSDGMRITSVWGRYDWYRNQPIEWDAFEMGERVAERITSTLFPDADPMARSGDETVDDRGLLMVERHLQERKYKPLLKDQTILPEPVPT